MNSIPETNSPGASPKGSLRRDDFDENEKDEAPALIFADHELFFADQELRSAVPCALPQRMASLSACSFEDRFQAESKRRDVAPLAAQRQASKNSGCSSSQRSLFSPRQVLRDAAPKMVQRVGSVSTNLQ